MKPISRRRVIAIAAALLAWVGLIAATSYAALNDSAVLTNNSLRVGSVNLLLSNSQNASSTIYEETREGFALELAPGQVAEKFFLLKNTSSSELAFAISVGAVLTTDNPALAQSLTLEFAPVDSEGNILDGTHWKSGTVKDLAAGALPIDGVIGKGQAQRYKMRVALAAGYSQPDQVITYDLLFTGNQLIN